VTILLSGCNGKPPPEDLVKTPDGGVVQPNGVEISYEHLPEKVRKEELFDAPVRIENKGGYTVRPGDLIITLAGDDFDIPFGAWSNEDELEANIDANIIEDFSDVVYSGFDFPGTSLQASLKAKACYYYETSASGHLCLKPDIYKSSIVCSEEDRTLEVHTSAPIRITDVTEDLFPATTKITIFVKNVGGGTAYADTDITCADKKKKNFVFLESFKLGADDFTRTCGEANERLKPLSKGAGTTEFKCEFIQSVATVTREPFEIVLSYRYEKVDEAIVEIVGA